MNEHQALVKNAASQKQVKSAKKKEKSQRDRELMDLSAILSSPEGRRVMWRILSKCQTFGSVCSASGSMTYYNAGRQDLGHWLMAELNQSSEGSFLELMKENYKGEVNV